ncbi:MAG: hypothetical protein IKR29_07105 [Bacteroidales bacterium]|nr:hypothetical protein [Bacteroidales bacterium]
MKKRVITAIFTLFMAVAPAIGQVIYLDEDVTNLRKGSKADELGVMVPLQGQAYDQWEFVPLTGGLFMLLGMGGAYLVAKRKKE